MVVIKTIYYYQFFNFKVIYMDFKDSFDKFMKDAKRVLKVSRKPDAKEYIDLAKVSALGVVIIGGIGYIIVCLGYLIGL